MFTGIIEATGEVVELVREGSNVHLTLSCPFTQELKIDQSVAHNGACLTVVDITEGRYTVTAIDETLRRTNMGQLKKGDLVNLERCTKVGERLDGHIVQGHVDTIAKCVEVMEEEGSWRFWFEHPKKQDYITVEKGSITINGISLTVVDSLDDRFSVAIIPYTFEHTNFKSLEPGNMVNLEFDVVGKYVTKILNQQGQGQ